MTPREYANIELGSLFDEQANFDEQLRDPRPTNAQDRTSLTKGIVLHLIHQASRLLESSGAWKMHYKSAPPENPARIALDIADLFKLIIMLCNTHGISPNQLLDATWEKSMIVRQKFSEEWIRVLTGPAVLIDIDNVICDYTSEILAYLARRHVLSDTEFEAFMETRPMVSAELLGIAPEKWATLKHEFRTLGAKRRMRPIPGARDFLAWCKAHDLTVILMTSRPITAYPNIYNDTLSWLRLHGMTFDFIWWADQKTARLPATLKDNVIFAVDDDPSFIAEYTAAGIRSYWFQYGRRADSPLWEKDSPLVTSVRSFTEIVTQEESDVLR